MLKEGLEQDNPNMKQCLVFSSGNRINCPNDMVLTLQRQESVIWNALIR